MEQEKKLLVLCKQDLQNFTQVYDLFVNDVYSYAYSLTRNQQRAEDACSYTFLQAIEHINTYEIRDVSIKHWLFTIARNFIYRDQQQQKRSQSLTQSSEIEIEPDQEDNILEKLINEEDKSKIAEALTTLSSDEQEVIGLRLRDDMQFAQIARLLDTKLSQVKMLYYRSLEKIRVTV